MLLGIGANDSSGVLEMVSKAGYLNPEAQPQAGMREGEAGAMGRCQGPWPSCLRRTFVVSFFFFFTRHTELSKGYGINSENIRMLSCWFSDSMRITFFVKIEDNPHMSPSNTRILAYLTKPHPHPLPGVLKTSPVCGMVL